tara:strand:+ start:249 stop:965 length:717 start_codon:yes stop_codon:yes gene_type:complete
MKVKTKIYWAPYFVGDKDWTILFEEPQTLFDVLRNDISRDISRFDNVFLCPSFSNLVKKIFPAKFPFDTKYIRKDQDIIPDSKHFLRAKSEHLSSFKNCINFTPSLRYIFFSEEDVNMTLTSPYFSKSPHMRFGNVTPGSFNISKWFRQIAFEFTLWPESDKIEFKKGEHIAYCHFDTKNDIEFVQFTMSDELDKIQRVCVTSSNWAPQESLCTRYDRFDKSNLNKIVMREIKKNIVE